MRKAPLRLDWDDLISSKDCNTRTLEVEVVQNPSDPSLVANLNDNQIKEKIQRICSTLASGLSNNLSDKGAKLRGSLRQCQEELDRRQRRKFRKVSEKSERAGQSEAKESSGSCNNSSAYTATKPQQSSFATLFSRKLEERADPTSNTRSISIAQDNNENSTGIGKQNKQQPHENIRQNSSQQAKMNYRPLPFKSASSLSDKDNDCKVAETSPAGRSLSNIISSRLRRYCPMFNTSKSKASKENHTSNPRLRKGQDVVVLDEEEEEEAKSNQTISEDVPTDWKEAKIHYPSRDDPDRIDLSFSDIKCLDPEQYLISPIMNFYIRYLQRPLSPIGLPRGEYQFFNTYFYKKLHEAVSCKGDRNARFLKLRRWWRGVNIFQKAYIFLPIHGQMHWSLVIICIPAEEDESGPIVLHLDSLGMHASDAIFEVVECFLKEEWNYVNENGPLSDLPIAEWIWYNLPCRIEKKKLMVPQQKNEYDCGLFVLYFMERFINEAPEKLKRKDLEMFGRKWFKSEEASGLRKRIRDLLLEEFQNARLRSGSEVESPSCNSPDDADDDDAHELIEV